MQRVRHVLECDQDRVAILSQGLIVSLDCGASPMQQGAALEDRLCNSGGDTPREYRRIESLCRITSQPAADCELRQHVCGRHPDLRARHMQECLELANVWSLLDKLRRQTQRQALRQLEI